MWLIHPGWPVQTDGELPEWPSEPTEIINWLQLDAREPNAAVALAAARRAVGEGRCGAALRSGLLQNGEAPLQEFVPSGGHSCLSSHRRRCRLDSEAVVLATVMLENLHTRPGHGVAAGQFERVDVAIRACFGLLFLGSGSRFGSEPSTSFAWLFEGGESKPESEAQSGSLHGSRYECPDRSEWPAG